MAWTTTALIWSVLVCFARKLQENLPRQVPGYSIIDSLHGTEVINSEQYFMLLTHSACPFVALLQEGWTLLPSGILLSHFWALIYLFEKYMYCYIVLTLGLLLGLRRMLLWGFHEAIAPCQYLASHGGRYLKKEHKENCLNLLLKYYIGMFLPYFLIYLVSSLE